MSIRIPTPSVSRFAEAKFECPSRHTTKQWCWSDCIEVTCATCEATASRLLSARLLKAQGVQPMQYAVNPKTGHVWVPGRAGKKSPRGYIPHEVRTWRERDMFYREQRKRADFQHEVFAAGHELEFGSLVADGAATLRRYLNEDHVPEIDRVTNQPTGQMVRLTPDGRGFIRHALEQGGYSQPEWRGAEVSIAAWEEDRANYRDQDTGWRERRA